MGSCRKTTLQVHHKRTDARRCMVSRDPRTKVHEIWGISFHWPDPNIVKFRHALTNSVPDIHCQKFLPSEKVRQSSPNLGSKC